MVLELNIWGPAFSLPSIDAQCIAAVAYMTQAVPRGEWILTASSDPSQSPTNELPALKSGNVWIGGFRNIVDYVAQFSHGKWSLHAELKGMERADCVAFSSFIEAHGQPLIDLSLYVSTQNFTTITRPAYGAIQAFPLPYITLSSIRSLAKSRTTHLGLSSLDIDSDTTETQKGENAIPPSLRKPRTTIFSLLSENPESAAQIRLDALATSFFDPLQSLRGKKRYFVSQSPSSLDCLAFGYLSLALLPDLPSPWLANTMRIKYPQLCAFVHDLQRSYFNGAVTLEDAYLTTTSSSPLSGGEAEIDRERRRRANGKAALPWSPPDRGGLLALGGILASFIADKTPGISQLRYAKRLERELEGAAEDEEEHYEAAKVVSLYKRELWTTTTAVVGAVALMLGYMFHYGLLAPLVGGDGTREHSYHGSAVDHAGQGKEDENKNDGDGDRGDGDDGPESASSLAQFGDLGAALEALPRSWTGRSPPPPPPPQPPGPVVEVDVEVDNQSV